jgi:hypothetical protein
MLLVVSRTNITSTAGRSERVTAPVSGAAVAATAEWVQQKTTRERTRINAEWVADRVLLIFRAPFVDDNIVDAMLRFYAIRRRTQFKQMQIINGGILHFFNGWLGGNILHTACAGKVHS